MPLYLKIKLKLVVSTAGFLILFFVFFQSYSVAFEKYYKNSLGMEFVLIPAGSFFMGSPPEEPHRNGDEVLHEVTISRPFYIQITEVTCGQWCSLMGRSFFRRDKDPQFPKARVSWFDCKKFIEKLNKLGEGNYRLPTEAEWEYVCRAGSKTAYTWGPTISCDQAAFCNNSYKCKTCIKVYEKMGLPVNGPVPVKSFKPNAWGVYDMHGNLWEWCEDWYGPYPGTLVRDPRGPEDGVVKIRRGGSWFKNAFLCRSANRNYASPASRYRTLGFRVVKEISIEKPKK